ncbi:MAG: tape measure protein [Chitinophagaceae bacterium]
MPLNVTGDNSLEFDAVIHEDQFDQAVKRIENKLSGLADSANKQAASVEGFIKTTFAGLGIFASSHFIGEFLSEASKVRAEYQQLEIAFTSMLKSKEQSDQLIRDVAEFTAKSPFDLKEVGNATKTLLSFNVPAAQVTETLRKLGDISIGTGTDLNELVKIYSRVLSEGTLSSRELLSLTTHGIPIIQTLADQFHVASSEVETLVQNGKVGFPEVEKAISSLTGAGGVFFDLLENQSKTLAGQTKQLKGAIEELFNDVGKSGEGVFSSAIEGATFLVNHFNDLIHVIEVMVATYGAYKAAIIATNIVTALATAEEEGLTVVLFLKYRALQVVQAAQSLLNATLLKNPIAYVAAGIIGLIASFKLFSKASSDVKTSQDLLADAQDRVASKFAETEAKIRPYLEALKNANLSEKEHVDIYNKLKELDPKIVEGLNAKTFGYKDLAANVNVYLTALREQLKLESNKDALLASIKQEKVIQEKLDAHQKTLDRLNKIDVSQTGQGAGGIIKSKEDEKNAVVDLTKSLEEQKKVSTQLGEVQVAAATKNHGDHKRTLADIEADIKVEKDRQSQESTNREQFLAHEKKIKALEEEKKQIAGATKADISAANALENKANALLEKKKELLKEIEAHSRDAKQSGLIKEQSEIDKINEKYDLLIKNVDAYNKKVNDFNKKNPGSKVSKIGQLDIENLNKSRATEITNTNLKEQAELYIKNLDKQKDIFQKFEENKKQIGIDKLKEMFAEQSKGYTSYLKFLEAERDKLLPKAFLGIANVGENEKLKALNKAIGEEQHAEEERKVQKQLDDFKNLLEATNTFNQQKQLINKKYDDLEATLQKNSTIADFEERKKLLEQGRQEELDAAKNDLIRQSALYKKLNQDIIGFTRDRIKAELKLLKQQLKTDTKLTPQQRADIQGVINQYQGILVETNKVSQDFSKIADRLNAVSGMFGSLADAVSPLNQSLGDSLQLLSDMTSAASAAASAIASFASGDVLSGITGVISLVVKIIQAFAKAKESKQKAQEEVLSFQQRIFVGEQEYNQLLRERARQQITLNKLTLQGLQDQKRLLEQQKQGAAQSASEILAKLQKENFVVSQGTFFNGTKASITHQMQQLVGKSFEEIEKLFTQGQLTDKAKELFLQLKAIKDEGLDIDALLAENAEKFREALTGTTADSIIQSITDGFAQGKRSASDFAGTFQELMQKALLQSLQMKYLEGPLTDFFNEFATLTESDGQLTQGEINTLQGVYNSIIDNAATQFDQLQQIAGLNLSSQSGQGNALSGAIKGITDQQADLLAGQFNALRLTAIDILAVSRNQLITLNKIEFNTQLMAVRLVNIYDKMIYYYDTVGVKVR